MIKKTLENSHYTPLKKNKTIIKNNLTQINKRYQDHAHIRSQCGARVGNPLQIQFSSPHKARVGPTLA